MTLHTENEKLRERVTKLEKDLKTYLSYTEKLEGLLKDRSSQVEHLIHTATALVDERDERRDGRATENPH